jgi:hypothetical protein
MWRVAMQMGSTNPINGIGSSRFSNEYDLWYAPAGTGVSYANALSNYMTLYAEHGVFAFFVYIALIVLIIQLPFAKSTAPLRIVIFALVASLLSYSSSVLFTYMLDSALLNTLLAALCLGVLVLAMMRWPTIYAIRKWFLRSFVAAIASTLLVFLYGLRLADFQNREVIHLNGGLFQKRQGTLVTAPRSKLLGILFIIRGSNALSDTLISKAVLHSASAGYRVILTAADLDPSEGLASVRCLEKSKIFQGAPIHLIGLRDGGETALAVASRLSVLERVASINLVDTDLFAPAVAQAHFHLLRQVSAPVSLFYTDQNQQLSAVAAKVIKRFHQYTIYSDEKPMETGTTANSRENSNLIITRLKAALSN